MRYRLLFAVLLLLPSAVSAEDALWSRTLTHPYCADGLFYSCVTSFSDPQVSIAEHARVINTDTGTVVACGSTVAAGAHLSLEFVPHTYSDINWFAVGYTMDSPYGDWIAGAAEPAAGDRCVAKNFLNRSVFNTQVYASLSVDPPAKSLTGIEQLGCSMNGSSATCEPVTEGNYEPRFRFAPTNAHFYAYYYGWSAVPGCNGGPMYIGRGAINPIYGGGDSHPGLSHNPPVDIPIPAQIISCPITVVAGTPTNGGTSTPATPALSSTGSLSCTTLTPYAITMSATSPDSHPLRYLVDWDADGMTDELIPASGYAPSGTPQTASRTYATAGNKSIRVRAQDDRGLLSGWSTLSFTCTAPVTATDTTDDTPGDTGSVGTVDTTSSPDLQLRVVPSLVKKGSTTRLNWSATNVSSCAVTGTNGDSWNTLSSILGGQVSGTITRQTTYTLSCVSTGGILTKHAVVNVLPTWVEN